MRERDEVKCSEVRRKEKKQVLKRSEVRIGKESRGERIIV